MDAFEEIKKQVKEPPPVPIKTYQWEDIRRARRRGGYPWTYLDKYPFDESNLADFDSYTLRKPVAMDKNTVTIEELSDTDPTQMETDADDLHDDKSISKDKIVTDSKEHSEEEDEEEKFRKLHMERVKGMTPAEEYAYFRALNNPESSSADVSISQYLDKEESGSKDSAQAVEPSKEKSDTLRSQRAKSEETRRKRKHSIESSYSRVSKYSLSPLGLMKKLKDAKDKIKLPKLFTKSEGKLNKKTKTDKSETTSTASTVLASKSALASPSTSTRKPEGALYIHIPLKPPNGETDEFSYLEFEDGKKIGRDVSPIVEETKDEIPETPIETGAGVQLIILTAPSDDEILDAPSVPETPCETDDLNRMDELKTLAKDAVNKYSPETKRKVYAPAEEESTEKDDETLEESPPLDMTPAEEYAYYKALNNPAAQRTVLTPVGSGKSKSEQVSNKPPIVPSATEDKGAKKKKKVSKKGKDKGKEEETVMETQKTDDDKIQEQNIQKQASIDKNSGKECKTKMVIDEEDGLKTETLIAQIIDEDLKEKDKETEKQKEKQTEKEEKQKEKEDKQKEKEDRKEKQKEDKKEKAMEKEKEKLKEKEDKKEKEIEKLKDKEEKKEREKEKMKEKQKEKENRKEITKESPILKKKVSFKRRSKEDTDGIYEDVQITTEKVTKEAKDTKQEKGEKEEDGTATAGPEASFVDERVHQMHLANVQGMTPAEEYEYWSRVNCHDYEPVIPPPDAVFKPIDRQAISPASPQDDGQPKKPATPITDSDIEFLAARVADVELRTTGIITITTNSEDPSEALFVPLESALKDDTKSTKSEGKEEGHGKKIQEAIQKQATNLKRQASIVSKKASEQAEKIHTRVKSIKKPKMPMPAKPTFEKPVLPKLKIDKPHFPKIKIEKPRMPKMPDRMKNISLSLPRRGKRGSRHPTSTESTAGDSEKRTVFDFSTYPRIFRKKKRDDDGDEVNTPRTGTDVTPVSEKTTLPRFKFTNRWKGKFTQKEQPPMSSTTIDTVNSLRSKDSERSETQGSIRIPLHSEGSIDRESLDLRSKEEREDSVERRMRLASNRYDDDIDMNDAYLKENQEIHRASSLNAKYSDRWNHGTFHGEDPNGEPMVTDLNEEKPTSILKNKIQNIHAGSSNEIHRRGVLEEINSDEFFLRQKGISQDNIEVGAYLSSEIREAFRTPNNALSQLERGETEPEAPKRRPFKKPKRKKTPHVSQEAIQYDRESIHTEPDEMSSYLHEDIDLAIHPERPKRRNKKRDNLDMSDPTLSHDEYLDNRGYEMYENEQMEGIEQPGILLSKDYDAEQYYPDEEDVPEAPPRKHKSIRSLNAMSEHDSITGELNGYKEVQQEVSRYEHEYQIPTPDQPPKRPFRTRSRTRSHSRGATLPDEETIAKSILSTSQQSFTYKTPAPLPPSRRRSLRSEGAADEGFFTVPRSSTQDPVRPLRNYSTLGPSRPPRKRSVPNMTDEEKHIVDQYDEIEDNTSKDLQSGAIIQMMKDRPLPAPPRPPRKTRDSSRGSRKSERSTDWGSSELHELEASVQTEPLPDDFECEELVRGSNDRIITPTVDKYAEVAKPRNVREFEHQETITHGSLIVQPFGHDEEIPEGPIEMYSRSTERIVSVKREAESDKGMEYDETSEIPDEFMKLKAPMTQAPPQVIERIIERHIPIQLEPPAEVETLKAQKLQVTDLDVDRLAVNELHASRILVGDIESSSITVNEINSNSGNLVVSGIELPASFFQQLVEKLQEQAEHAVPARPAPPVEPPIPPRPVIQTKESETNTDAQPKTFYPSEETQTSFDQPHHSGSFPDRLEEIAPIHSVSPLPHTSFSDDNLRDQVGQEIDEVIASAQQAIEQELIKDTQSGQKKTPFEVRKVDVESVTPPQRPPRRVETESVDVDVPQNDLAPMPQPQPESTSETPPPRPPAPSQPPVSFYALRSPPAFKDFDIDDDIPLAPRRRRPQHHQHHKPPESSSEDVAPNRRRHRTPEPSIPQLTGQLTRACLNVTERSFKRLIQQITDYVMATFEGKPEVNVAIVILIVFIALLFLVGWNTDGKQIHHHHWEYFNPPRDI